jgi:hypothetical protein
MEHALDGNQRVPDILPTNLSQILNCGGTDSEFIFGRCTVYAMPFVKKCFYMAHCPHFSYNVIHRYFQMVSNTVQKYLIGYFSTRSRATPACLLYIFETLTQPNEMQFYNRNSSSNPSLCRLLRNIFIIEAACVV